MAKNQLSRLALKIIVVGRQEARGTHARVKRFWEILLFFTQFGFIMLTYLRRKKEEGRIFFRLFSEFLTHSYGNYQFKLATTRKLTTDAYEGRKRNLEREIAETTQQKGKDWTEREKILTDNQKLFTEYQQQAVRFPTELEEAVKKTREDAIKETSQKAKVEVDLFEKEWESTKQSYEFLTHSYGNYQFSIY